MITLVDLFFVIWFIGIFLLIISEKIDKSLAALIGAIGIIALGVEYNVFQYSDTLAFLDLGVIGILVGTFIITEVAEEVGLFEFTAIRFLKISRGDPKRLFLLFSGLMILLSAILSNLVATVLISSLTIVACRNLGLDPKPYIFGEAIFANLGGVLTLISSVPNILVSLAAGIGFIDYLLVSIPISLIIGAVTLTVLLRILEFKDKSDFSQDEMSKKVDSFDEWSVVRNKANFKKMVVIIAGVILLFIISDFLQYGLEFIALVGAAFSVLFTGVDLEKVLSELDWGIIFFVGPLLVLVEGFSQLGLIKQVSVIFIELSAGNYFLLGIMILWLVGIFSSMACWNTFILDS
jgi:Na+/H+ antiporter NhaD/arsenite permease-like protein